MRLLSIAHSYCVALNRRLAHEFARLGTGNWEVTAVAPDSFRGDLRRVTLESYPGELERLESVPAHFSSHLPLMLYGWRLLEILREPWDLVHCWEEPYVFAGGQVAWWTPRNTRFVFYSFQNISKWYPPPFSWIEEYCLKRCTGWIASGVSTRDALLPRGYGRKPHRIVPLGVDIGKFCPNPNAKSFVRSQLGWTQPGPPVIGYLGRFVPQKGLHTLMRVLDRIASPWRALFVGGGPMESQLRQWAADKGDRVRVVTDVRHDDVAAYLNAMDILCAPSQTMPGWREQLGRMLIEAFACGVPVIASRSGEIPHVVADAGLIVGEKDEEGWAEALSDLLENPSRRADLAARGVERARTLYAWPVIAQQHLDFFGELVS